jgi:hypothetical protein
VHLDDLRHEATGRILDVIRRGQGHSLLTQHANPDSQEHTSYVSRETATNPVDHLSLQQVELDGLELR